MIDEADRVDAALALRPDEADADLRALIDCAGEIGRALASWRLAPAERDLLYARALALAGETAPSVVRRWRIDPKLSAVLGGAVVAAAAAAAVGVLIARGRRQQRVAAAASV
jgi:hypothetical protein